MEDKYLIPISVLVAAALLTGALIYSKISPSQQQAKITPDQTVDSTQNTDQNNNQNTTQPTPVLATGIPGVTSFTVKDDKQICKQDGKPVVYLFSTTWCPHCVWVKPIFDKVAKEYISQNKIIAYHWELDTFDNSLTDAVETSVPKDQEAIYKEFNPSGSIPTFVFGCKYHRVGNGPGREQSNDTAAEEKELRAIFDYIISQP